MATGTRRAIWMSEAFAQEHKQLYLQILETLSHLGGKHKWRLLPDMASFCVDKALAEKKKAQASVVALVSDSEAHAANEKYVMGPAAFLQFISNHDLARTTLGLCGL